MTIVDDLREHCEIFTMVDVGNVRLLLAEIDRLRAENDRLRAENISIRELIQHATVCNPVGRE